MLKELKEIKANICEEVKKYAAVRRYNSNDLEMINMLTDAVKDILTIEMLMNVEKTEEEVGLTDEDKATLKKLMLMIEK